MPHEFKDDTLEDIKKRDILNLETILKKNGRVKRHFSDMISANEFQGIRLNAILEKIGVSLDRAAKDSNYNIEGEIKRLGVRVENRVYQNQDDEWRSGLYIYKDDEIAGFVGHPIYETGINFKGYDILCTEKI